MAPHSSTLAWKIPRTEEPGRLQSMGSLRVRHDWATSLSLSCIGEGNGNPLQCSCLENPRDSGAWWAAVYGVTQSRKWPKRLSSSSSQHRIKRINWHQKNVNRVSRHWSDYPREVLAKWGERLDLGAGKRLMAVGGEKEKERERSGGEGESAQASFTLGANFS